MKKNILLLTLISACAAQAQWWVEDASVLAQTIINTHLTQNQLQTSQSQLATSKELLNQIGKPGDFKQVIGAAGVIQAIQSKLTGTTLEQIQTQCTGITTLANTGNGLYRAISQTIQSPDGMTVQRQADRYRPSAAVDQVTAYCQAVNNDTETRRNQLLEQIKATTEQVQNAQTLSEVHKLQVVATAENAALSSLDAERLAALSTVLVQEAQNRSDAQRQQQARAENSAVDFRFASKKAATFLSPFTAGVTIPTGNSAN